jgi:TolB protein
MRTSYPSLTLLLCLSAAAGSQQPQRPMMNGGLPFVSPDGNRIAFISNRTGAPDVFVVGADGSGLVQITRSPEPESAPQWSGKGDEVIFSIFAKDTSRIFAANATTAATRVVGVAPARSPFVSRDGRRLLYSAGKWPAMQLTLAALDGSSQRTLTDESAAAFNGVWSPDERWIAYARADSARQLQIWVMNADGSGARQLTHFAAEDGSPQWPSWSPDGRRLAVQAGKYNRQDPKQNTAHIWVIDVASGAPSKLAPHDSPYLDETPSWFPDGRRIAFQSDRSGRMELWVMNADGTGARQVTR